VFTFRVGPFPVTIEPSFLMVIVLFNISAGIPWMLQWGLVVFVSVLVHELGHALVFRSYGARPEIRLHGLGGLTLAPMARRLSPKENIWTSLAGPLAGLLPALASLVLLVATNPEAQAYASEPRLFYRLALGLMEGRTPFEELLVTFVRTGFFWTVLNLLPVFPLDGGSILASALAWARGKPSTALAGWISTGVAAAMALATALLAFSGRGGFFLPVLFAVFAVQSAAIARGAGRPAPATAPSSKPDDQARADASAALREARSTLAAGDEAGTEAIAARLDVAGGPLRASVAARIRAGVLLARGENGRAGLEAGRAFSLQAEPDAAVIAARAALRAGEPESARNWLRRAVEAGARPEAIAGDAELAAAQAGAPA
jgi:Zn-dependent protease